MHLFVVSLTDAKLITTIICQDTLLPMLKLATASKTLNLGISKPTKLLLLPPPQKKIMGLNN
jgi:hypothetical protein